VGAININRFFAAHPRYPEIALVVKEPDQQHNIGGGWHTDHSYDFEPALGSILVARELPPQGGATAFASMYAAYEALPPALKEQVDGLHAVHSARHVFGSKAAAYEALQDTRRDGRIGNAGRRRARRSGPSGGDHPSAQRQAGALCEPQLHRARGRPVRCGVCRSPGHAL
jgi:taurine dioxygenase